VIVPSPSDWERRIALLEAENAALRAANERPVTVPERAGRRRGWARTLLATVLVVVGCLLAPVATVAAWANVQLTDTDRFVASYSPLARDPAIQAFVTDQAVAAIEERVDIAGLTSDVIDGVIDLGTGPAATRALELLKGPAAQGIQNLIAGAVGRVVTSDGFADVWDSALRISHTQLTSALRGDPASAIDLAADGTIGINLAPVIDAVKERLVAQGLTFAEQIPSIDRVVTVTRSDAVPTAELAYALVVAVGLWLPWVAIALLAAGVVVARRRSVALIATAVSLAVVMAILLAAFAVGRVAFLSATGSSALPSTAASSLYETFTRAMRDTSIAVLVLAVAVAVVGWFTGPFRIPQRMRAAVHAGAGRIRGALERRGLSTGAVGRWMYAQRLLLRVAVAVIAAAIVLLVRPLTPALTFWTLVSAVLVVFALEVVERPPDPVEVSEAPEGERMLRDQ
jgi:hypothetical protein